MPKYLEQIFPIKCRGRDFQEKEVLVSPIDVKVTIYQKPGSNIISSLVDCQYNAGSHGQLCNASSLVNKTKEKVNCPYSFDLPHALEKYRGD